MGTSRLPSDFDRFPKPGDNPDLDTWRSSSEFAEPNTTTISVEGTPQTGMAIHILCHIVPEALALFLRRNRDYGEEISRSLGTKGIFVDINRKTGKLYRQVWLGEKPTGEGAREILMDMIGHCLLAIANLDEEEATAEQ